jgi:hypothetical protein
MEALPWTFAGFDQPQGTDQDAYGTPLSLGVKGSQVQILSARPESGFSQLRGCGNPLFLILGSFVQVSTAFGDTLTGGWPYEGGFD